jgi:hypothetical protein
MGDERQVADLAHETEHSLVRCRTDDRWENVR